MNKELQLEIFHFGADTMTLVLTSLISFAKYLEIVSTNEKCKCHAPVLWKYLEIHIFKCYLEITAIYKNPDAIFIAWKNALIYLFNSGYLTAEFVWFAEFVRFSGKCECYVTDLQGCALWKSNIVSGLVSGGTTKLFWLSLIYSKLCYRFESNSFGFKSNSFRLHPKTF